MSRQQYLVDALYSLFKELNPEDLARRIDATLLSPIMSEKALEDLIKKTSDFGFKCAMIPPSYLRYAQPLARKHGAELCTVVGFPAGFSGLKAKMEELDNAASVEELSEVDIVPDFSRLLENMVGEEIAALADKARSHGLKIKVIVEAPLHRDEVLEGLVKACYEARVDFVKTSTGVYSKGGDYATVMRVKRMSSKYGLKVKAAGGIRDALTAIMAIAVGADRLGTSSFVEVVEDYRRLRGLVVS